MGEPSSVSLAADDLCPQCRSKIAAFQALNHEHSRCAKKIRSQQDMIQKLEAAAKLLNKMLYDDKRHRAFLQERLDTAEQALYLRTCLSEIQHPPKRHRRKPAASVSQECSTASVPTEGRTFTHDKEARADHANMVHITSDNETLPKRGRQHNSTEVVFQPVHQLSHPPSNLRDFVKVRRSGKMTLSFSESTPQRPPESSIRQDSLAVPEHDRLESNDETESTLSESGTLTLNPSRTARNVKPRKISELEHPDSLAVPGIDSLVIKQRMRDASLGPTATSDDGDSGEFDSRQSPLFSGTKDIRRAVFRTPVRKPAATISQSVEKESERQSRKPQPIDRSKQQSDLSEISTVIEQQKVTKKDRTKSPLGKRETNKRLASISQSPPETFLHKSEDKLLQRAKTNGFREWKSRQQGPTETQSDTQISSNFRPKKPPSKAPINVPYSTLKLARRIDNVPPQHLDAEEDVSLAGSSNPSPTEKKHFPAARTTKSTKLKDGFTKLKYENPEQQWVSRAGPARGL